MAWMLLLTFLAGGGALAQTSKDVIKPMRHSDYLHGKIDWYVYVSGSFYDPIDFVIGNSTAYNKSSTLKETYTDLGLCGYYNFSDAIGVNVSLGYKRSRYANNIGLSGNGMYTHWLTFDANVPILYFSGGICSDVFLGSRLKNNDNFTGEGLNEDCFNKITFCYYISIFFRMTRLKVEVRAGVHKKAHENADKIAYYNMLSNYVGNEYIDIRLSYRIYSSGNRLKSPYDL